MDWLSDEQLIARLQAGETGALDELYRRYAGRLYAYYVHSSRVENAQDLVQETFLRVIKSARSFDPQKASFRTWLFRIARNQCIDATRREKIIQFLPLRLKPETQGGDEELDAEERLPAPGEGVESAVLRSALFQALRECVAELKIEAEKQALLLYYLGSKVFREVGEVLGQSTSTAKNRVQSAQGKVRRCLEGKGFDSSSLE